MNVHSLLDKVIHTLAGIGIFSVFIFSCLSIAINIASPHTYHVTDLLDNWVDENGNSFSLNSFHTDSISDPQTQSVICTLDSTSNDMALLFRSRNMFVDIYVNDILVSEDDREQSVIFGTSPGSRWHMVALDSSNPSITIRLEGTPCYTNVNGLIDNIYAGSTRDVYRIITSERFAGFILSVFLQFIALVLICLYAYVHKKFHIEKDLLYLGEAAFFSAQWASAESLVWQLFFGYSEVFHLLGYLSLIVVPIPFGLLGSYRFKKGRMKTFSKIFSLAASINLLVTAPLHMLGIVEFHYTMKSTHILIVIMLPLIACLLLSYTHADNVKGHRTLSYPAIIVLTISVLMALSKYYFGTHGDYTLYIRIALLCFLFCLILYQLNQVADLFAKGLKSDMIHAMALTDYLTGLYNRTAFAEHKKLFYNAMIEQQLPIGVIQFDVNNLKYMNDTFGHEKGDELIKLTAEGLKNSFQRFGRCYRMGGDEFLVVLTGNDPEADYRLGIQLLHSYCDEINQTNMSDFSFEVAHGFVLSKGQVLEDVIKEADGKCTTTNVYLNTYYKEKETVSELSKSASFFLTVQKRRNITQAFNQNFRLVFIQVFYDCLYHMLMKVPVMKEGFPSLPGQADQYNPFIYQTSLSLDIALFFQTAHIGGKGSHRDRQPLGNC